MYRAKLISADFKTSTMEFEIDGEFTAKKGNYIIMSEEEFNELSDNANNISEEAKSLKKWREDYEKAKREYIVKYTINEYPTAFDIWSIARDMNHPDFIKWLNKWKIKNSKIV